MNSKSNKRRFSFAVELQKELPFTKKTSSDSDIRCNNCSSNFSVSHGGRSDIRHHLNTDKHKKGNLVDESSAPLNTFFETEKMSSKDEGLAAVEGTFVYHIVCQSHSLDL